jgi:DNA-binding transcriptional ArsR family regulator
MGLTAFPAGVYCTEQLINRLVQDMTASTLDATFAALADPTRRAILARLSGGEASVTELAQPFNMTMPAVSKHLKVLERAGLITRGREAQWRPCRLKASPLKDVADWVAEYREHWEQRFDRLDQYLRELQAAELATGAELPAGDPDPGTSHGSDEKDASRDA